MVTAGTKSQVEISQFKAKARELGVQVNEDAFTYLMDNDAWMLDADVLQTFVEAQAKQLVEAGLLTQQEVIDYVNKNVSKALGDAIDIESFLQAETESEITKQREKLRQQLINAGVTRKGTKFQPEDEEYYVQQAMQQGGRSDTVRRKAQKALQEAKAANQKAREEAADQLIDDIEAGGKVAVDAIAAIKSITGEEMTAADIESAYRSRIAKLEEASEQLSYGIGGLVSGDTVAILEKAGYTLQKLGDGNSAVILQVKDISEAYQKYYDALKETNTATLEALNEAYARVLETKEGRAQEQNAIDALGEAAGMTYSTLGAILSEAGMSLEDNLEELESSGLIESMGGNKIRITDFVAFARRMSWSFDSEEYTSGLKAYNDSLIERNSIVKETVLDEVKGLEDIKPGDWLNLTQTEKALRKAGTDNSKEIKATLQNIAELEKSGASPADLEKAQAELTKLQEEDTLTQLNVALLAYGATLSDGILKLADDANIFGIAETLKSADAQSGLDISDDMADMLDSILNAYTDLIVKGIEGSLTNVEKSDLIKKAGNLGVELHGEDFVESADGYALSMNKMIELYTKWGSINNKQQKQIYKALSQQLKDNNSNYKTATQMLTHLIDMQKELDILKKRNNTADEKQIEQLKNEIKLIKEMQMYSLTHEDQSWNFMSTDAIPDSIDNALNYFSNWHNLAKSLTIWGGQKTTDMNQ